MLTDQKIKSLKPKAKQYKVADGEGMHLLVKPNGRKYWQLRYRYPGKEKTLALGFFLIFLQNRPDLIEMKQRG